MQNLLLLLILLQPHIPAINTHHRVIKIHTGFAGEVEFKTEVDINYGIDQPDRVYQDMLLPAVPDTGDT